MPFDPKQSDYWFGTDYVQELRAKFLEQAAAVRQFTKDQARIPDSLTPADLLPMAQLQSRLSGHMFHLASLCSLWQQAEVEVAALCKRRQSEHKLAIYKFMIDDNNKSYMGSFKSEEQKVTAAEHMLNLIRPDGIEYCTDLVKGWHKHFEAAYAKLSDQKDALLTALSILRTEIGPQRPFGNNPQ